MMNPCRRQRLPERPFGPPPRVCAPNPCRGRISKADAVCEGAQPPAGASCADLLHRKDCLARGAGRALRHDDGGSDGGEGQECAW